MEITLYGQDQAIGGYKVAGMTLVGPLLLSGIVVNPMDAVHKQYVDTAAANLNASNVISGTLNPARMPALFGDFVSQQGTTNLVLVNSPVVAGDYTKVTVNSKGIVINGGTLSSSDIPSMSWNKITIDLPNTLAGYGITDGFDTDNGIVTGYIRLNAHPTLPKHAATKTYAESALSSVGGVVTGDIINRPVTGTPNGFFRCNGATLNKASYAALYSVIGNTYSDYIQPGSGQPWRLQYDINQLQFADIPSWLVSGASLPSPQSSSGLTVTKNRVYLIGGASSGTTVYTAAINSDGTLGTWTVSSPLSFTYNNKTNTVLMTLNHVHIIGGNINGNTSPNVYTASINPDGTIGTFVDNGLPLPTGIINGSVFLTTNKAYLVGGVDASGIDSDKIFQATINADGTLGSWVQAGNLLTAVKNAQCVITKNRVHLIGGTSSNNVCNAPINSDGTIGTWVQSTPLPNTVAEATSVVVKNKVYLIGGILGNGQNNSVYTATVNSDGSLGTWLLSTAPLPSNLNTSNAFATATHIYTIGGVTDGNPVSVVYRGDFSGSLNSYAPFYDGTVKITSSDTFNIPDYTSYEATQLYFFIKY